MGIERRIPGVQDRRIFEDHRYCLAVDLGQSVDPTAICVLQNVRRTEVTQKGKETPLGDEYHVRHLARLPLGLSYVAQVEAVANLLRRPPLTPNCELVIDDTGVGRAVGELFDNAGLRPTKVTITSGERSSPNGTRSWHVPKGVLISSLDAALHTKALKFAAELAEASAMADELSSFRRNVSAAGRYTYDARVGKHDDLVLAVALGLWSFVGKPKFPVGGSGTYRTSSRKK